MNEVVRVHQIRKAYDSRPILIDVTLHISRHEGWALVGPSGSGKTTLLRIIAGLDRPDSGDVWIEQRLATRGREICIPPHKRGIGFVFQDLALWPHLTVSESLDFVLASAAPAPARAERRSRIDDMLRLVHIARLSDRYPHQLSGGEQQRAALARALVHRPPLRLLDEPFSSLDADLRHEMRRILTELRQTLGFAMVFVTHDRTEAAAVADRIIDLTPSGGDA